jgi:hypothetical protein
MTNISLAILAALHEHKEIHGTDTLAEIINAKQEYVTSNALILHKYGLIDLIIGSRGRGHKTIYRDKGVLTVERHHE